MDSRALHRAWRDGPPPTQDPTLDILFDPTFDSGSWPDVAHGPPSPWSTDGATGATAGVAHVGPAGLLGLLETMLGLGGIRRPQVERAAALIPWLKATGFWGSSAAHDPLGTALRVLEIRDAALLQGWRGEAISSRLDDLRRLGPHVVPGPPDRVLAALGAIEARRQWGVAPPIRRLGLIMPDDDLAVAWRRLCEALGAWGVAVERVAVPEADGEPPDLQLLRAEGPVGAADHAAAWIAALDAPEECLLIGADATLDDALRRHGLPCVGARDPHDVPALLRALPLALAMLWRPPDPAQARELLLLPGLVPRRVARHLVQALDRWPAVASPAWSDALSVLAEEGHEPSGLARVRNLFSPRAPHGEPVAVADVQSRVALFAECVAALPEDDLVRAVRRQLAILGDTLTTSGLAELTAAAVDGFVEEATAAAHLEARPPAPCGAQAGLAAVGDPGGVWAPVRHVVWWNFTAEAEGSLAGILSPREEAALRSAGLPTPDRGARAVARAARYRRPLALARASLLLVCPRSGPDGEERNPHPLWDELLARDRAAAEASIVGAPRRPGTAARRRARRLVATPPPRRWWQAPAVPLRPMESASSMGSLAGCPFQWTLTYAAHLHPGLAAGAPNRSATLGSLVHRIFEVLFRPGGDDPLTPETARARAHALFDADAARLHAALFLPGEDQPRAEARHIVGKAAEALAALLAASDLRVVAMEEVVEAEAEVGRIQGRIDMLLERATPEALEGGLRAAAAPRVVVDLKLGGATRHGDALRAGTAYQLATYGRALVAASTGASGGRAGAARARAPFPPAAYFILRDARLLTTARGVFDRVVPLDGPDAAATWAAFADRVVARRDEVGAGQLEAPANPDENGAAAGDSDRFDADAGRLDVAPACRFCDFGALCGRTFQPAAPPDLSAWMFAKKSRRR